MISTRADHISKRRKIKEFYADFNINMDFDKNTGSLIRLTNANAIKESIKNLVLTEVGERFYHPEVGSIIHSSLFGVVDELTSNRIKDTITMTIQTIEPRAQTVNVTVHPMPKENAYVVNISFTVINIPNEVFHITDIINRVR